PVAVAVDVALPPLPPLPSPRLPPAPPCAVLEALASPVPPSAVADAVALPPSPPVPDEEPPKAEPPPRPQSHSSKRCRTQPRSQLGPRPHCRRGHPRSNRTHKSRPDRQRRNLALSRCPRRSRQWSRSQSHPHLLRGVRFRPRPLSP